MFEAITSLSTLEAAWEKVKDNAGAAGGDGETVGAFAAEAPSRLLALHRDLRSGRYHPGPNRVVLIPKRSGGTRPLSIPCVQDRVVHTAIALVLTPHLDALMAEGSFGYRPGRSVRQAVARIEQFRDAGYQWVIDADIERYFERVPHDALMTRLGEIIDDAATLDLIEQALIAGSESGRGLAQGSPLSPLLSNLYLDGFDDAIEQGEVRLVRFADDFVLLCRSEVRARDVLPQVAALLEERGLRLNPEKTRIVDFADGRRLSDRRSPIQRGSSDWRGAARHDPRL
jgi:CRISPR-associated protein Cas1